MNGVGFGELIVRMVVSLVVVLGLLLGAYWFMKRRQSGSFGPRPKRSGATRVRLGRSSGAAGARQNGRSRGLKIVGRVGVSRTSHVVALQFAQRIILLGTSEQGAPAVLAEMDLDAWNAANETDDELVPIARLPVGTTPTSGRNRPSLLEALREVTARRA